MSHGYVKLSINKIKRILQCREGMTLKELGIRVGKLRPELDNLKSPNDVYLSSYMHGHKNTSPDVAHAIAQVLDVELELILDDESADTLAEAKMMLQLAKIDVLEGGKPVSVYFQEWARVAPYVLPKMLAAEDVAILNARDAKVEEMKRELKARASEDTDDE